MPPSPLRHRRPYHHGDLERTLLDAAIALVREGGVESLSLRAMARAAGVSHAAPYHHFPDRRALLDAVAQRALRMLLQAMEHSVEEHAENPLRQFQAAGVAYVVFAVTEPHLFRLIFTIESPQLHARPALRQPCQEIVHRMAHAGIIKVTEDEIDVITLAAWALVHGFAQLALDGQLGRKIDGIERAATEVTSMFLTGIIARTSGASL